MVTLHLPNTFAAWPEIHNRSEVPGVNVCSIQTDLSNLDSNRLMISADQKCITERNQHSFYLQINLRPTPIVALYGCNDTGMLMLFHYI